MTSLREEIPIWCRSQILVLLCLVLKKLAICNQQHQIQKKILLNDIIYFSDFERFYVQLQLGRVMWMLFNATVSTIPANDKLSLWETTKLLEHARSLETEEWTSPKSRSEHMSRLPWKVSVSAAASPSSPSSDTQSAKSHSEHMTRLPWKVSVSAAASPSPPSSDTQ